MHNLDEKHPLMQESPEIKLNPKYSLLFKILFVFFVAATIALLVVVIVLAAKDNENKEENNNPEDKQEEQKNSNTNNIIEFLENVGHYEPWHELYGIKLENISYAINSKINNSYGINGTNYNPEIGNINGGQDYEATERNMYNLYIPKSAMDKKDKYNGIFIYLHGGTRFKEDMDYFCSRYAKMGYIAATVDYNEITTNSQNTNFFRYLDELTVAISDIKQKLKENWFNENKLELALGGHSLGGHLSMLYGYSMQNKRNKSPIPIKFIINQAGSLDIDQEYAYKVAIFNKTLSNIEPDTINEAIKNGTLIPSVTGSYILKRYNSYLDNGNRYSESQIKEMLDDNENIKYDSELYQNFSKITKYFYGSYYINETAKKNEPIIPVIFEVAGNDANMGIAQYKLVKLLSEKYNFTLDLVYMRYANHSLLDYETPNGIEAYRDFHEKILKFAELYFKSPDYDMEKLEKQVADAGRYESWNILYGIKLENLSYATNGIINNTYKEGGENYNPEIGNINDGEDYEENDKNVYNLYIPIKALNKKNNYNGVFLFIHGGTRPKEDMDYLCARYVKMGYITATLDWNEVNMTATTRIPHSNFFRYFYQLTACILNIKQKLEEQEFDVNKLELALGGYSLGGHLSMIYGYAMQNKCSIPIKFLIDQVASPDYILDYSYRVTNLSDPLPDIEPETIDAAIKEGKLAHIHTNISILTIYNNYLGCRYNFNQLLEMLDKDNKIKYDSELYKNFSKSAKYCKGSYYIKETVKKNIKPVPLLCLFGGLDMRAGVAIYKFLKYLSDEYKFRVDLVYMKYGDHSLLDSETENGQEALKELHLKITEYAKLYFKVENYDAEKMEQMLENGGHIESWHELFGIKLENVSYAPNGIITNTYAIGKENYNPEIGNINDGENYNSTERNQYNLYIPTTALNKKDKYNGIIIFMHGGTRYKEDYDYFCARYAKSGYITVTLDYNEINANNPQTNFFRYIDEITTAIAHIKQKLKDEYKFDETKLGIALGEHSLGGHLSMLYGYSMHKKSPIPIKFIINQAATFDFDPQYAYKVVTYNVTLPNLDPETIDEGIKNGILGPSFSEPSLLAILNSYINNRFNSSQISEMLINNTHIDYDSELYQEFYNITKYFYGSYHINETVKKNETITPLLMEVGGNDERMGVAQYKLLKILSETYGNFTLDLVYMRYGSHSLMDYLTENGQEAMKEFHLKILEYAEKFFVPNESDELSEEL